MEDAHNGWGRDLTGRILRTADGGLTWRDVSPGGLGDCGGRISPQEVTDFAARRATVAMTCYSTGADGRWSEASGQVRLFHTADQGASWQSAVVDTGYEQVQPTALTFVDDANGWLVVQPKRAAPTTEGLLFRTTDGGRTWARVAATQHGLPAAGPIRFLTPERGWTAAGDTLFTTVDGGSTWAAIRWDDKPASMTILDFVDEATGFGAQGSLWSTTDGGRTWRQIYPSMNVVGARR